MFIDDFPIETSICFGGFSNHIWLPKGKWIVKHVEPSRLPRHHPLTLGIYSFRGYIPSSCWLWSVWFDGKANKHPSFLDMFGWFIDMRGSIVQIWMNFSQRVYQQIHRIPKKFQMKTRIKGLGTFCWVLLLSPRGHNNDGKKWICNDLFSGLKWFWPSKPCISDGTRIIMDERFLRHLSEEKHQEFVADEIMAKWKRHTEVWYERGILKQTWDIRSTGGIVGKQ